ncbi:MAG: tetratricopeptide repeat protein [Coleofasciculus sp. C1-SOL-03]|uniref:tetratricopeptide repeat protein n=1 Tax=Coleofasciculus sp. C1-SOL-03 TaxID=3069522 RepID=UPI0032FD6346
MTPSQGQDINEYLAQQWLQQGYEYCKLEQFEQAIASFDKALQIKPDYHLAWCSRGVALGHLGENEKAIKSFDKALQFKPDDQLAWRNRGLVLVHLGKYKKAIASFDKALQFKPDDHEVWNSKGAVLCDNLGRDKKAIASFDKALQIKPDYHLAWHKRGLALKHLGEYEKAIACYDKALQFKPDDHLAWYNRGLALDYLGEYKKAIASYDKALQFKPDLHEAWNSRGVVLCDNLGRYKDAIISFNQALQFKPDDHLAWHNRGVALLGLREYKKAIANYDKALQLKPDFHNAWDKQGVALFGLREYKKAIANYDKALKIKPDYYEAWNNRGNVLADLGEYEEAIANYDKALKIKPDYYEAWNNQGLALAQLGEYEKAITNCDKAIQFKPDFHDAWHNRGNALAYLGEHEEAIVCYDKALQFKPDFHDAWLNRGIAAGNSRHYNPEAATVLQFQFPNISPILPNPALTQRGYPGELLSYQEGLKHCLQDTHPEGWGLLHQYIGKAHYQQGKYQRNYRDYWHKAVTEYRQALITLTPDAYPEQHLEVLQDLIRVLLGLNQHTEAKEWRNQGLKVFQTLLNSQKSTFQISQLRAKFLPFSQMRVDVLVEEGEPILALKAAEMNKNLYLTWIFDARKETTLSPDYRQIQSLTNPTTAIIYWHLSPNALTTFIIKHDRENPIIIDAPLSASGEVRGIKPLEDWIKTWDEFYQDYRKNPLQPPCQKSEASSGFPHGTKSEASSGLPLLKGDGRGIEKGGWKGDKRGEQELGNFWQDKLPNLLEELHHILNIPAILTQLNPESITNPTPQIHNLILIPHRDLHCFPLHALFPDTFTITYLPSAQIGLNLNNREETPHILPLQVDYPPHKDCEPLPYAEIESAAIAQLFPNSQRLSGKKATKTAVTDAINGNYTIFHFTGHGTYNNDTPQNSALLLNDQDKLTINDIRQLCLNHYQLVTLAACETALTGRETIEKDYVGLVSAFVYQGVSHVLSTLWTIPDHISSLLFIVYFYWQLKKGKPPAVALVKAQNWLRNLTYQKLRRYYWVIFKQLPREEQPLRPFVKNELWKIDQMEQEELQERIFEHPYYWAAFTITGSLLPPSPKLGRGAGGEG